MRDLIKKLQIALNFAGENLKVDGDYGVNTDKAYLKHDVKIVVTKKIDELPTGRVENPSYVEAKKYDGKKEKDSKFSAWLSSFWPKTGLKYKTIAGTSFAWCALFIVAMQSEVGQKYIASASAKSQGKTGIEIDWKKNGMPRGAIVHINHGKNCSSSSNNHVTFADGDCTSEELLKKGGVFAGFGGNQNNEVNRSIYSADKICEVRWPSEVPKPGAILKSVNCSGKESNTSTK